MKKAILGILFVGMLGLVGCASLQKAAKETTADQVQTAAVATAPLAATIPMPYGLLGAPLIALLAAIGTNWWNDKHPKATTTVV